MIVRRGRFTLALLAVAGCSDGGTSASERSAARVAVVEGRGTSGDPVTSAARPHEVAAMPAPVPSSAPSREPDDGLYVREPPGTPAVIRDDLTAVVSPPNQLPPPGLENSVPPENIVDVHRGE